MQSVRNYVNGYFIKRELSRVYIYKEKLKA
jgi:hypothetical protein